MKKQPENGDGNKGDPGLSGLQNEKGITGVSQGEKKNRKEKRFEIPAERLEGQAGRPAT